MSKQRDQIRQLFCELAKSLHTPTVYGTVQSVDEKLRTCTVKVGDIVREGVLLCSLADGGLRGFCFIPKIGSKVVITPINDTRSYVSMFSEVDKVLLTIGDKVEMLADAQTLHCKNENTELKVTAKGFTITRDGSGLLKSLTDLCDAISKLTVTTAVGASGVPINVADFAKIKSDLKKYLEG